MTNVREPAITDWRATLRRRTIVAAVLLGVWMAGIEGRLVFLQVVRHPYLSALASRQQSRTMDAAAKRGDILDRRGRVLATSVDGDSVYAVPSAVDDPSAVVAALCRALGDCHIRKHPQVDPPVLVLGAVVIPDPRVFWFHHRESYRVSAGDRGCRRVTR